MTKVAIITGGSRGIGKATALKFAKEGVSVIFTYNSSSIEAEAVEKEIALYGVKAKALKLDVSNRESYMNFAPLIANTLKEMETDKFDILINNAGVGLNKKFVEINEEEFDYLTNVHYRSVYFISQKLVPLMNEGAAIVNISSGLTRLTYDGYSLYASLKGAVETLTKYMAKEFSTLRIRVNCVAPGATVTDFANGFARSKQVQEFLASQNLMGRVGEAEDIADVIYLVSSDNASWMHAQRIEASGGQAI